MLDKRMSADLDAAFSAALGLARHVDIRPHPAVLRTLRERVIRRKRPGLLHRLSRSKSALNLSNGSRAVSALLQGSLPPLCQAVGVAAVAFLLVAVGRPAIAPHNAVDPASPLHASRPGVLDTFFVGTLDTPLSLRDSLVSRADSTGIR